MSLKHLSMNLTMSFYWAIIKVIKPELHFYTIYSKTKSKYWVSNRNKSHQNQANQLNQLNQLNLQQRINLLKLQTLNQINK